MDQVNQKLLAALSVKDDLAFKLGDTLDVKASICMVLITFLSTQTAYLLDKHVNGTAHELQAGTVICLVIATVAAIVELWPRRYVMVEPEENLSSRIPELVDHYSKYPGLLEQSVIDQLTLEEIGWAKDRIASNQAKNKSKSRWLDVCFYATACAMSINATTMIVVWFIHPF